jgi:hypothetical protein
LKEEPAARRVTGLLLVGWAFLGALVTVGAALAWWLWHTERTEDRLAGSFALVEVRRPWVEPRYSICHQVTGVCAPVGGQYHWRSVLDDPAVFYRVDIELEEIVWLEPATGRLLARPTVPPGILIGFMNPVLFRDGDVVIEALDGTHALVRTLDAVTGDVLHTWPLEGARCSSSVTGASSSRTPAARARPWMPPHGSELRAERTGDPSGRRGAPHRRRGGAPNACRARHLAAGLTVEASSRRISARCTGRRARRPSRPARG